VFGTALVYIVSLMDQTDTFLSLLALSAPGVLRGQVWRLVTFLFVPSGSNILFLLISLYFYYMVGGALEAHWGTGKFTIYYLFGMVTTILYCFLLWLIFPVGGYLSAYYINLSLLFAFSTVYSETPLLLFGIIPIKAKWLGILSAAMLLYDIFRSWSAFPFNLLHLIMLLNYLLFCGGDLLSRFLPRKRRGPRPINFKKAARRAAKDTKNQPSIRKCAVCGKTDLDYPNLEFRYCSRCEGFHCFCIDHINNHVHFDH